MLSQRDVIVLPLGTVVYPPGHPLAGQRGVVNAFALRHPAGLILVDTGIGEGNDEIDAAYRPARRPLLAALREHGLALEDVTALVNTHLHFDHCGMNRLFPGIPIHVQAADYAAAQTRGFTIREWVDFPGAVYHRLEGEWDVAPGVRLLPTPGHTPGHQCVLIETGDGALLLAGQAVQSLADYKHLQETGDLPAGSDAPDEDAYRASARRLLTYAPRRVLFSHDDGVWDASVAKT